MPKRVIISITNDLTFDQRVKRTADTFVELGYEVGLVGRLKKGSVGINRSYKTRRLKLLFGRGPFFYAEYNLRLFLLLLFTKKDLLVANDLDTLLPNYLIGSFFKIPLLYDSHEYFTEVPELIHRKFVRRIWVNLERYLFPRLENAITVNEELALLYQRKYKTEVKAIRNFPETSLLEDNIITEVSPTNRDKATYVIYQGALNVGRGIELMIQSMRFTEGIHLHIFGTGDIEKELQSLVRDLNLEDRVRFFGAVPPDSLALHTRSALLGLSLEEDLGLNYRLALPNKIFDYIQSRIPVIVSDLPVMGKIVKESRTGEVLENRTAEDLGKLIDKVAANKDSYRDDLLTASNVFTWENEKSKLIKIIEGIEQKASYRQL